MLFQIIKRIMPFGLLARAITIIAVPLIALQGVLVYIFLERHMEIISKRLASSIAGDTAFIISMIEDTKGKSFGYIQNLTFNNFKFKINLYDKVKKLEQIGVKSDSWLYGFLESAFKKCLNRPYFIQILSDHIRIEAMSKIGMIKIEVSKSRLFSRTTPLVAISILVSTILILLVTFIFMRNQVKPIMRLANAAEEFGKGNLDVSFTPSGAKEVRQAGHAFLKMKDRIRAYVNERFEMLTCISHDLRTPVTRFKLQLVCMEETVEVHELKRDVEQMQSMLEAFLAYANSSSNETAFPTELYLFFMDIIRDFSKEKFEISFNCNKDLISAIRRHQFRRCISNIISNAQKFSTAIHIEVFLDEGINIEISDNGPGIKLSERENVFRPFYKLDEARNLNHFSGIGLGLSIAKDIILSHGGSIILDEVTEKKGCIDKMGGLLVRIRIPK